LNPCRLRPFHADFSENFFYAYDQRFKGSLTRPVEPVPLELLAVVPLEDLVDADDVARRVRRWFLVRRIHGRSGNCCHLNNIVGQLLLQYMDSMAGQLLTPKQYGQAIVVTWIALYGWTIVATWII
jgi:hypothetical protein